MALKKSVAIKRPIPLRERATRDIPPQDHKGDAAKNVQSEPATHPLGLRAQIARAIEEHGPQCDLNHLDISQLTTMEGVFADCAFNGDISKWDTSRIVSMRGAFRGSAFTGDISKWDVSNVNDMAYMFMESVFDGDISAWNVSSLRQADHMFERSQFNGDISKWNVAGDLQTMARMFAFSRFQGDLRAWDLKEAIRMGGMFLGAEYAGDLSSWHLTSWSGCKDLCSADFRGVLPRTQGPSTAYEKYASTIGGSSALEAYLQRMPLNAVHADLTLQDNSGVCPSWLQESDFSWIQEQREVMHGLGCTLDDARSLLAAMMAARRTSPLALPDGLLLAMDLD